MIWSFRQLLWLAFGRPKKTPSPPPPPKPPTTSVYVDSATQLEAFGNYRWAAVEWMLAADEFDLAGNPGRAEECARKACVCAERAADVWGRQVPTPNQSGGDA